VIELLDEVMAGSGARTGGHVAANRTLAGIRSMFNFALDRGIIDSTPAARVRRPGEEQSRERTLTAEEIAKIWRAAATLGDPFGPYFRMALLSAQRRDEVARMQWADLDLDTGLWTLPAQSTKARRSHVVPLAPLAIEILKAIPRKEFVADGVTKPSPWVFTTAGDAPVSGFSKAKPRLDRAITPSVAAWRIHDLRRTVATEMGRLGVAQSIVGKVLNHADRSITAVYNRYDYLTEKRQALDSWAAYLNEMLSRALPATNEDRQAANNFSH
jgi:integrase